MSSFYVLDHYNCWAVKKDPIWLIALQKLLSNSLENFTFFNIPRVFAVALKIVDWETIKIETTLTVTKQILFPIRKKLQSHKHQVVQSEHPKHCWMMINLKGQLKVFLDSTPFILLALEPYCNSYWEDFVWIFNL